MYIFKNVVLSRKGFDSSSGYGYSPFDPTTGKYITIPIPIGKSERQIANKTRYEQISIRPNYLPGINASDLRGLIFHDSLRLSRKSRREVSNNFAHIDPWLGPCPWLAGKSDYHLGALGQVNAAQGHLANHNVGVGSLFLFFSRFIPVKNRDNNISVVVNPLKGAYFLYGWLKVGRVVKRFTEVQDPKLETRHPHATESYFSACKNNTIYISDKFLNEGSKIPGCGYFPRLNKNLLLTSKDYFETPTVWELPRFFYDLECRPTFLKKEARWQLKEDSMTYLVTIPARGQEFIFRNSRGFQAWLSYLFEEFIE